MSGGLTGSPTATINDEGPGLSSAGSSATAPTIQAPAPLAQKHPCSSPENPRAAKRPCRPPPGPGRSSDHTTDPSGGSHNDRRCNADVGAEAGPSPGDPEPIISTATTPVLPPGAPSTDPPREPGALKTMVTSQDQAAIILRQISDFQRHIHQFHAQGRAKEQAGRKLGMYLQRHFTSAGLQQPCVICRLLFATTDHHPWGDCPHGALDAMRQASRVRNEIYGQPPFGNHLAKYSCCGECLCPQYLCRRWATDIRYGENRFVPAEPPEDCSFDRAFFDIFVVLITFLPTAFDKAIRSLGGPSDYRQGRELVGACTPGSSGAWLRQKIRYGREIGAKYPKEASNLYCTVAFCLDQLNILTL